MFRPDGRPMAESSQRSRLLWTVARIGVTLGALGVLFAVTDTKSVAATLRTFPIEPALITICLAYVALAIGTVRWKVLMITCGATHTPPLSRLYRLSLIGFFYNNVLPGGVAGDVIRGVVTTESFGERGATSSIAVTLLERLSGLVGLLVLGSCAFLMNPLEGLERFRLWGLIGFAITLGGATCVAYGAKLAPLLPGPLGVLASKLPEVKRPAGFVLALLLSLGTQTVMTLAVHVLVKAVYPELHLLDSAVVIPVISMASYFPLTVAGAGAREYALVTVYGFIGVSKEKALAAALAFFACQLLVAVTGGLLNLVKPLTK